MDFPEEELQMSRRETVEEFLARGGVVTKCPPQAPPAEETTHRVTPTTPGAGLMTLSEGSIFYAEIKAKPPKKRKETPPINVSALPASLLKYVKVAKQ
jgi:hypothetical protein